MAARRVRMPTADDLFRPTREGETEPVPGESSRADTQKPNVRAVPDTPPEEQGASERRPARKRRPSGRVRHDEKMTVYVTSDELLDIEHARLSLRRNHALAVDRGRLVREAVSLVLAELEEHGEDSALVRRLTGE